MSDISYLAEDEYGDKDFFLEEANEFSEDDEKTDKKMRVVKIIFGILCVILVAEFCLIKFVKPSLDSPKVTISGVSNYTAEELATLLLPMNSKTWYDFDVERAVNILSAESGIKEVVIEKKYPNKIMVNVTERVPVAVTFVVQNGNTIPVQIDDEGILFYNDNNSFLHTGNLPIVSGIPLAYLSNGMRIPSMYLPLIEQIAEINKNHSEYFAGISEICVIPNDFNNYELALISAQSKVKVITDRALNEDALKDMMVVLDVINLIDTDVREVDLRYRSVSYKPN